MNIRVVTAPTVEIIGRQKLDYEALDRFLAACDTLPFRSDAPSAAEALVEVAGRLCFDDQTDLLTPWGWKPVSSIGVDCPVATMNPQTGQFEYQLTDAFHEYPYDGDLLTFEGRDVSFSVTPEHRQYAARSCKNGFVDEFRMEQTEALLSSPAFKVKTAAKVCNGHIPDQITAPPVVFKQTISNHSGKNLGVATKKAKPFAAVGPDQVLALARLVTHYVANGSITRQKGSGAGLVIYGREQTEIRRLADILGLPTAVWIDPRNGCPRTIIGGGLSLAAYFEWACGRGFAAKKLPGWVMSLPAEQLREIWDILVRTDGRRTAKGRERFDTGSEMMVGHACEILAKIGHASSTVRLKDSKAPCWSVRKKDRTSAIIRTSDVRRTPYKGKVYCVTTQNGIVYTRRNGRIHYSGNCYWSFKHKRPGGNAAYIDHILDVQHGSVSEHAVWTVLIAGVSRSLTHELIRHRVGLSPSQLSQRFYDESDCAFVLPPLIPNDIASESYIAWLSGCRESLACYTKLCKVLSYAGPIRAILDATMRKKRVREAARSVLSNSVETRIALTGNARAWRWFCSLRGAEAADLEIRRLAAVLANRFKTEAPNLFHDVKISCDDNDWPIVTVGHPKV